MENGTSCSILVSLAGHWPPTQLLLLHGFVVHPKQEVNPGLEAVGHDAMASQRG